VVSSISSIPANTVAPYAPLGRQAVGQESTELKTSSFKALEQTADAARSENRRSPDDNPNEQAEQQRLEGSSRSGQQTVQSSDKDPKEKERRQQEQEKIAELAARDREVRAHEQAHAAVAGAYAGGTTYQFVRGPDGVSYAVGGEVSINTSPIPNDPEATIRKAQQIRQAANAPADPSSQDRSVAAQAARMEIEARAQLDAIAAEEARVAEQQSRQEAQAQKASIEGQATQEEERRAEEKREIEREQLDLSRRQERAEILEQAGKINIDINRRLIEIGAVQGYTSVGSLLNSVA
jgi:hypothetical protein